MKKLWIVLIFLPLVVYGADLPECQRVQSSNDIPCELVSTFKPSTGCLKNIDIFSENISFINSSWQNSNPFCIFVWNTTTPGRYIYNSSIEDGIINVEPEDNMLSIILVQIGLIIFYILVGLPHKFGFLKFLSWSLALIEIVITVWMIYINETGNSFVNLLYINAISSVILGGILGFLAIIMLMAKMMMGQDKNQIKDDSYTKFVFNDR